MLKRMEQVHVMLDGITLGTIAAWHTIEKEIFQ